MVDGQEGESGYEGFEQVSKQPKISLPKSLSFMETRCLQVLLDIIFHTDVARIGAVAEKAENTDHKESSNVGV